jgi:chorismate lyase/3-hydroxybenzoate synthase
MSLLWHKLEEPTPPRWVVRWLGPDIESNESVDSSGMPMTCSRGNGYSFVEIKIADAVSLDDEPFQQIVANAYRRVRATLAEHGGGEPIRIWNFIPGIDQKMSDGRDRYEHFNMGRHDACIEWWGEEPMTGKLAAASGVGHPGDHFIVQVLAADNGLAGRSVENPRQVPAYRYSARYGVKPPCFARATVVPNAEHPDQAPVALIAGTAAVCGEDSRSIGDLQGQFSETIRNLASLVAAAEGAADPGTNGTLSARIAQLHELRIYVSAEDHIDAAQAACDEVFNDGQSIEWMVTTLCRPELWVEIEGIANLAESS